MLQYLSQQWLCPRPDVTTHGATKKHLKQCWIPVIEPSTCLIKRTNLALQSSEFQIVLNLCVTAGLSHNVLFETFAPNLAVIPITIAAIMPMSLWLPHNPVSFGTAPTLVCESWTLPGKTCYNVYIASTCLRRWSGLLNDWKVGGSIPTPSQSAAVALTPVCECWMVVRRVIWPRCTCSLPPPVWMWWEWRKGPM